RRQAGRRRRGGRARRRRRPRSRRWRQAARRPRDERGRVRGGLSAGGAGARRANADGADGGPRAGGAPPATLRASAASPCPARDPRRGSPMNALPGLSPPFVEKPADARVVQRSEDTATFETLRQEGSERLEAGAANRVLRTWERLFARRRSLSD